MTVLVLSGLIRRRAELLRDLTITRNKLAMMEIDIASVEGAIRVFAPGIDLKDLAGKRIPAFHAAPEGAMTRFIFAALRTGPMTTREIALLYNASAQDRRGRPARDQEHA